MKRMHTRALQNTRLKSVPMLLVHFFLVSFLLAVSSGFLKTVSITTFGIPGNSDLVFISHQMCAARVYKIYSAFAILCIINFLFSFVFGLLLPLSLSSNNLHSVYLLLFWCCCCFFVVIFKQPFIIVLLLLLWCRWPYIVFN